MSEANREYKDRLFKFIFGNPANKEWTLSLYNAVNGSHYEDASAIRLTTIEDAVYMGMKNDVSFLVADTMSFYEQQSTLNPNMPMRFLIYAGMVYAKYIKQSDNYHPFSSALQKAPTPRCVCFYNGTSETEDRTVLSLADAFDGPADIDVRVTMLNINYGRNIELMNACQPLMEYALFVEQVRQNQERMRDMDQAVDAALTALPDGAFIKPFLLENQAEVKRMCLFEYDEARLLADTRKDGVLQGRKEGILLGQKEGVLLGQKEGILLGREETKKETALRMLQEGLPMPLIEKITGLSEETIRALAQNQNAEIKQ